MKVQTLSILIGNSVCNAQCPYCISKMTPKQGIGCKSRMINWRNFEKACKFAKIKRVTNVLLTGKGELTLFPEQITEVLKKLGGFNFPIIELQTNGILFNKKEYENYLREWYKLGLTFISISIVHYKTEKNKEIFVPRGKYPNLSNIIKKLHRLGYSVRLSCTMIKDYTNDKDSVYKLINFSKKLKVEQLSLRKLSMPNKYEDKESFKWCIKNRISEKSHDIILDYLKRKGNKLMTLPHGGEVYDFEGQNVCFTDALTIKPETDNIRQLIFFPDGHLRFDWQYEGAVII